MSPVLKYLLNRIVSIPIMLVVITMMIYAFAMKASAEDRAALYWSSGGSNNPEHQVDPTNFTNRIIKEHGLNDPYLDQYLRWIRQLVKGDWGWSPKLREDVLPALLYRTPATVELTFISVLFMIPLGIISGVISGVKERKLPDFIFRFFAFIATSIPLFIMALVLLTIFYAGLSWFPPGRISYSNDVIIASQDFRSFTGLLTIDGLLNRQPEITLDALKHLVLPAFTITFAQWAILGRLTRQAMIEELNNDYVAYAKGKGVSKHRVVWIHALKNALLPAINSTALSAASLITGVYVVERIFDFPGVSSIMVPSFSNIPDTGLAMGFMVYSVMFVLPIMIAFDLVQIVIDPRLREEITQ